MRKIILISALLLAGGFCFGQNFTLVSGAAVDANGIPYGAGTVTAHLVTAGVTPTLNGLPFDASDKTMSLNAAGAFTSFQLVSNAAMVPNTLQYTFKVCGYMAPPLGVGNVCFTTAAITISGATQTITTQITAAVQSLIVPGVSFGGGGGTPSNPLTSVQFNNSGSFGGDAAFTWDNTNKLATIGNGYIATGTPAAGSAVLWNGSAYAITVHGTDSTASAAKLVTGTGTLCSGGNCVYIARSGEDWPCLADSGGLSAGHLFGVSSATNGTWIDLGTNTQATIDALTQPFYGIVSGAALANGTGTCSWKTGGFSHTKPVYTVQFFSTNSSAPSFTTGSDFLFGVSVPKVLLVQSSASNFNVLEAHSPCACSVIGFWIALHYANTPSNTTPTRFYIRKDSNSGTQQAIDAGTGMILNTANDQQANFGTALGGSAISGATLTAGQRFVIEIVPPVGDGGTYPTTVWASAGLLLQ